MKYRIRFNQTAGQPGRGSVDHKWRVFDQTGKEWICKAVNIKGESWTEIDPNGHDWNIACVSLSMKIDKISSTIMLDKI
jgi:hypothetical protein